MFKKTHLTKTIGVMLVIAIVSVVYFNWRLITIHYHIFKADHFSKNDKLYISQQIYSKPDSGIVIPFFAKFKSRDGNDRELAGLIPYGVSLDSLRKYKTRCIGSYEKSAVLYGKFRDKFIPGGFYAFKADKRFTQVDSLFSSEIPKGYEVDTQFYYVPYSAVTKN
ncbi:hypothetical protein [Mucilaginibacter ginkgonis]|uniref:Uncharacterized protein n=1 Tax=Mucilaginibacter ginkgonis TaxID=2682091 RepID=A0A6I4HTY1_9SPHI|nr:hypothetical protein [Mucilaginibacter ginkgonis]QQL50340.1 hypothetical protein GO620_002475 [Mucilaginibacter ginkgonis]